MRMIGHEIPHENANAVFRDFFLEHREIVTPIPLPMKHVNRANTNLCDMVRILADHDAPPTSHRHML
jgi:hypothetical protein